MPIKIPSSGPSNAEIMIVGEAPGSEEERQGQPFVGPSGSELNRMLHEAGISRSQCFITNVCQERPYNNDIGLYIAKSKKEITKDHIQYRDKWVKRPILEGIEMLKREIELVNPGIIIALGNVSMWALTGKWGIMKWRGSMLHTDGGIRLTPTYHPALILRQWEFRAIAVHDLKRASEYRNKPFPQTAWRFRVRPSFSETMAVLERLEGLAERKAAESASAASRDVEPSEREAASEEEKKREEGLELSFDIETRAGHIACIGLAHNYQDAICIPFMCVENLEGYWSLDDEAAIVFRLYRLLTHPGVVVVGQYLHYDCQYTYRHWHFVPRRVRDTIIQQHVAFAGLPKKLDFQASMYCDQYVYWKDDSKEWDKHLGESQLWTYNCEDCVRTLEVSHKEQAILAKLQLEGVNAFQQEMFWPVLQAMQWGVRIDKAVRGEMGLDLFEEMTKRERYFKDVLGHPLNPRSSKQMLTLFYDDLKLPVQRQRGKGTPTLNEEALVRLASREPLIRPLVKKIMEYRSLGVFLGTFVKAPLDVDDRMRCSYNISGTYTYRLSSSKNAFGGGANQIGRAHV